MPSRNCWRNTTSACLSIIRKCWAREIRGCETLIVLVSADSMESRWVVREVEYADEQRKSIVVVRLDATPLPEAIFYLQRRDYIDASELLTSTTLGDKTRNKLLRTLSLPHDATSPSTPMIQAPPKPRRNPLFAVLLLLISLLGSGAAVFYALNLPNQNLLATPTVPPTTTAIAQQLTSTSAPLIAPTTADTATPTRTPTDTPLPTLTPIPTLSEAEQEAAIAQNMELILTEQAQTTTAAAIAEAQTAAAIELATADSLTATATWWTLTPTADLYATAAARLTQTQAAVYAQETQSVLDITATVNAYTDTPTPTPTYTSTSTPTPTATNTPTPVPTRTPMELAQAGASSNAQWTPLSRVFEDDEIGATMMLVPAGTFTMGSSESEIDYALQLCIDAASAEDCQRDFFTNETPTSVQTMTEFWIDRTEVTRGDYAQCVAAGECSETADNEYSTDDNQPINRVTWAQAGEYCAYRGARLPTEAEWEYAARGPDGLIFPWGNETDGTESNHCDGNCGEQSWAESFRFVNEEHDDGFAVTAPVGSYPQSASWVGALDLAGNLWEWTSTVYEPYHYDPNDGREDLVRTDVRRILRGGSFDGTSVALRAANRVWYFPGFEDDPFGFRCARS